ncbi:DNA methyltransferase [Oceanicola sp. 22II-s10i]|uniref:16S rRNA (guanine(966)-N(2))-methyltransferase RsmD n=1 Tax=Oceanicola sp. 22II-s10i TaxID=1317116 RepID=UPI000B5287B0|nr:16S rRNA (guanine(966)-N(2))-methyltransferase RsmD [Oceanicola sp. 22II-s10i]OWU86343.1 DNA methyltransferase [Oceanicola sp. 22II-s10i]
MRIIAGDWRGRTLASVGKGDPGAHLRPTTDRVRESLFSTLSGGRFDDPLTDAVVLDLFAGTGALGLEALSRGAATATFVDDGRIALRLLRDNIAALNAGPRARTIARDARRLPPNDGPPATLVFLDPPYGKSLGAAALAAAERGGWIVPDALIVWEENAEQPAPDGYARLDARKYGDTTVTFLRRT